LNGHERCTLAKFRVMHHARPEFLPVFPMPAGGLSRGLPRLHIGHRRKSPLAAPPSIDLLWIGS